MTPDDRLPFAAGFMDDYFAEADEHIVTVRRSLLALEAALGSELPSAVLEELFRSCHSIKGISAMVELRQAELLAHHMESCLRAVRQHQVELNPANFEALVDAARMLEAVVAARRSGGVIPDVEQQVRQLKALRHACEPKPDSRRRGPAHRRPVGQRPARSRAGRSRSFLRPSSSRGA
jgi:two-component system chemotaxis sensor kinase CheA